MLTIHALGEEIRTLVLTVENERFQIGVHSAEGNLIEDTFPGLKALYFQSPYTLSIQSMIGLLVCDNSGEGFGCLSGNILDLSSLQNVCQRSLESKTLLAFLDVCKCLYTGLTIDAVRYRIKQDGNETPMQSSIGVELPASSIWSLLVLSEVFGAERLNQECKRRLRIWLMPKSEADHARGWRSLSSSIFTGLNSDASDEVECKLVQYLSKDGALSETQRLSSIHFGRSVGAHPPVPSSPSVASSLANNAANASRSTDNASVSTFNSDGTGAGAGAPPTPQFRHPSDGRYIDRCFTNVERQYHAQDSYHQPVAPTTTAAAPPVPLMDNRHPHQTHDNTIHTSHHGRRINHPSSAGVGLGGYDSPRSNSNNNNNNNNNNTSSNTSGGSGGGDSSVGTDLASDASILPVFDTYHNGDHDGYYNESEGGNFYANARAGGETGYGSNKNDDDERMHPYRHHDGQSRHSAPTDPIELYDRDGRYVGTSYRHSRDGNNGGVEIVRSDCRRVGQNTRRINKFGGGGGGGGGGVTTSMESYNDDDENGIPRASEFDVDLDGNIPNENQLQQQRSGAISAHTRVGTSMHPASSPSAPSSSRSFHRSTARSRSKSPTAVVDWKPHAAPAFGSSTPRPATTPVSSGTSRLNNSISPQTDLEYDSDSTPYQSKRRGSNLTSEDLRVSRDIAKLRLQEAKVKEELEQSRRLAEQELRDNRLKSLELTAAMRRGSKSSTTTPLRSRPAAVATATASSSSSLSVQQGTGASSQRLTSYHAGAGGDGAVQVVGISPGSRSYGKEDYRTMENGYVDDRLTPPIADTNGPSVEPTHTNPAVHSPVTAEIIQHQRDASKEARWRAAQRIRERRQKMQQKDNMNNAKKKQEQDQKWAVRDKKIALFKEKQMSKLKVAANDRLVRRSAQVSEEIGQHLGLMEEDECVEEGNVADGVSINILHGNTGGNRGTASSGEKNNRRTSTNQHKVRQPLGQAETPKAQVHDVYRQQKTMRDPRADVMLYTNIEEDEDTAADNYHYHHHMMSGSSNADNSAEKEGGSSTRNDIVLSGRYSQEALAAVGLGMSPSSVRMNANSSSVSGRVTSSSSSSSSSSSALPDTGAAGAFETISSRHQQQQVPIHQPRKEIMLTNFVPFDHMDSRMSTAALSSRSPTVAVPLAQQQQQTPIDQQVKDGSESSRRHQQQHNLYSTSAAAAAAQVGILSVKVIRAWDLVESLGGTNAYVVLDWGRYGKSSTQAVTNTCQPQFGATLQFKSPYKLIAPEDVPAVRADPSMDVLQCNDSPAAAADNDNNNHNHTSSSSSSSSSSTSSSSVRTYVSFAGPMKCYVFNRNQSVSDELLAQGEIDIHGCIAQGSPDAQIVHLVDPQNNAAGAIEFMVRNTL